MTTGRWMIAGMALAVSAGAGQAQTYIFQDGFESYAGGNWLAGTSNGVWTLDGCNDGKISSNALNGTVGIMDAKDDSTLLRRAIRSRHSLTTTEMLNASVKESESPNCVDGTDANPLKLDFFIYLGPWTGAYYYRVNQYMEITCGSDRAPTAMVASTCSGTKIRNHLSLNQDGLVHRALAVGAVAMADTDPCDDGTQEYQRNFRLSVYDGLQWHFFTTDELHICPMWNRVTLTVKTNTIDIAIESRYENGACAKGNNTTARSITLPRRYTGPFTSLAMGGLPKDDGGCWDQTTDSGYVPSESGFDEVYLFNGVAKNVSGVCEAAGACCHGDHTCQQATPTECASIAGATFKGLGTACGVGEGRCCSDPVVNIDDDADVDMADFAKLQRCVTTGAAGVTPGCECFDTNEDGAIDETDIVNFAECASGAGVPADIGCDDNF